MIAYRPMELHTHTLHSDGAFTVEGLCEAAKARELQGVALTDHNTFSGLHEATPELAAHMLPLIPGIEWTTFFGHLLVIGADKYVDWRTATPDNIDEHLKAIREANGVAGIAHPFALGSPFCTGCFWEYRVRDWSLVDYIEVWNEPDPQLNPTNDLALQWWTDLLNQGHRLAATCGTDWHGPDKAEARHKPVTYLGLEDGMVTTASVRDALHAGRVYVTSGPELSLEAQQEGNSLGIGDQLHAGKAVFKWCIDNTTRAAQWQGFGIAARKAVIVQNGAPLHEAPCSAVGQDGGQFGLSLWPGWIRLEIIGDYQGEQDQLLAFTSPIYIRR